MTEKIITVREACRKRQALSGTDAQALEGALSQAEQEIEKLQILLECKKSKIIKSCDNCVFNGLPIHSKCFTCGGGNQAAYKPENQMVLACPELSSL